MSDPFDPFSTDSSNRYGTSYDGTSYRSAATDCTDGSEASPSVSTLDREFDRQLVRAESEVSSFLSGGDDQQRQAVPPAAVSSASYRQPDFEERLNDADASYAPSSHHEEEVQEPYIYTSSRRGFGGDAAAATDDGDDESNVSSLASPPGGYSHQGDDVSYTQQDVGRYSQDDGSGRDNRTNRAAAVGAGAAAGLGAVGLAGGLAYHHRAASSGHNRHRPDQDGALDDGLDWGEPSFSPQAAAPSATDAASGGAGGGGYDPHYHGDADHFGGGGYSSHSARTTPPALAEEDPPSLEASQCADPDPCLGSSVNTGARQGSSSTAGSGATSNLNRRLSMNAGGGAAVPMALFAGLAGIGGAVGLGLGFGSDWGGAGGAGGAGNEVPAGAAAIPDEEMAAVGTNAATDTAAAAGAPDVTGYSAPRGGGFDDLDGIDVVPTHSALPGAGIAGAAAADSAGLNPFQRIFRRFKRKRDDDDDSVSSLDQHDITPANIEQAMASLAIIHMATAASAVAGAVEKRNNAVLFAGRKRALLVAALIVGTVAAGAIIAALLSQRKPWSRSVPDVNTTSTIYGDIPSEDGPGGLGLTTEGQKGWINEEESQILSFEADYTSPEAQQPPSSSFSTTGGTDDEGTVTTEDNNAGVDSSSSLYQEDQSSSTSTSSTTSTSTTTSAHDDSKSTDLTLTGLGVAIESDSSSGASDGSAEPQASSPTSAPNSLRGSASSVEPAAAPQVPSTSEPTRKPTLVTFDANVIGMGGDNEPEAGSISPTAAAAGPTEAPVAAPTINPSPANMDSPTVLPTVLPGGVQNFGAASAEGGETSSPTLTSLVTASPTKYPSSQSIMTSSPTATSSDPPTSSQPTKHPSEAPTSARPTSANPTLHPTDEPSPLPGHPTRAPVPPSPSPTSAPRPRPTPYPSKDPTPRPTRRPSTSPPTRAPRPKPTPYPSPDPTPWPSRSPTTDPPTAFPTARPTRNPTTHDPSPQPTPEPTPLPGHPTKSPVPPTPRPSRQPTDEPTGRPTDSPTPRPSPSPISPRPTSAEPTAAPISLPPTAIPTMAPSALPTTPQPSPIPTTASPTRPVSSLEVDPYCFDDCKRAGGVMFNVVAKNDISILGFSTHIHTVVEEDVEIYTKEGTFLDAQIDQGAWERVQATTIVEPNGKGSGTRLPNLYVPIWMKAGQTRSFYVTLLTSNMDYSVGDGGYNDAAVENDDIVITNGVSKEFPFLQSYGPRRWEGAIHYNQYDLPEMVSGQNGVHFGPPIPPSPAPTAFNACASETAICGPNTSCPDGTCCSQWGFCGTTPEYCGECCQNGSGECWSIG